MELKKENLNTILKILEVDNIVSSDEIDGLLLKKMASSNIIKSNKPVEDTGKQSHIAITSKERVLFPMVSNVAYYEGTEDIKFYDMRLPVTLVKTNIEKLDKKNKIKFTGDFLETETLCYIRKGKGDIQVQISKTKSDGEAFINFRKLIYENDYLCVIKMKEKFKFLFLVFDKSLKEQILESFNTEENLIFINDKSITEIYKTLIFENKEIATFINKLPLNRIIYGAPGTGKSYQLDQEAKGFYKIEKREKEFEYEKNISEPNYWIATCGEQNSLWDEFQTNSIFAVGWDQLGDLTHFKTNKDIREKLKNLGYPNKKADNQWYIVNSLKRGDILAIRKGIKGVIEGYGVINGDYSYDLTRESYQQTIPVEWTSNKVIELSTYNKNFPIQTLVPMNKDLKRAFKSECLNIDTTDEYEEFEIKTVERVTFYDGYTHGQFVGSYKPVPKDDSITYEYVAGPFMKQLVESYKNPNDDFCLIIEEINRARADKVFGNIFQLLDRHKDGESQYPIALSEEQITYLTEKLESEDFDILKKILEKGLFIPKNLYIWATMNSADQGVYALDSAFKRRWNFEHIGLNGNENEFKDDDKIFGILFQSKKVEGELVWDGISWNKFRRAINKILLKKGIFEDRLIAPFFVKLSDFHQVEVENEEYLKENFHELKKELFLDKVLMYLFDDVLKHKTKDIIFDPKYKSFSDLKVGYNLKEFEHINSIFTKDLREELEEISKSEDLFNKENEEV